MASAKDIGTGAPEQVISWNDFYNQRGHEDYGDNWVDMPPDHWPVNFDNFFTGNKSKYKAEYEAYLQNLQNRNEWKAVQDARAWDKFLSDTQYQRMVEDLKKAGLNPWLAVQSGMSGSSVPQSAKASYSNKNATSERKNKNSNIGQTVAMLMLAVARLLA